MRHGKLKGVKKLILSYNFVLILYLVFVLFASLQSYFLGTKFFNDIAYTHYNNFLIFKYSFIHLIENQNLYLPFPNEHFDLYKYSPTFALLFGFFQLIPDSIGIILWNFLNAYVLFLGIRSLPNFQENQKIYMLLFLSIEFMTSLQNQQSNGLMAGLLLLSFSGFEKNQYFTASLYIVLTVFIKIFGAVFFLLLLLYPNKTRSVGYSFMWAVILFILPLILLPFSQLAEQYSNWYQLLISDHSASVGTSVMGLMQSILSITFNKLIVLSAGLFFLLLPLLLINQYKSKKFRFSMLSMLLIWMVIFNHKAESPTYIIAISGVAIWGFSGEKSWMKTLLLLFAFILTSLSPTDIFPPFIRNEIIIPYALKALPCIVIWGVIVYELLKMRKPESEEDLLSS
ncbi:MAG: DUF2029 domain-containing protein [Bacteroidales bacterium]|nr:DUF2029 domain-containing protein [Bacteroidales bacterium]MCF8404404.1 DUF2029 domain-containing protein [Bacteroidales bacterium]